MTVFTYSRVPAFNPNTTPVSVAKSASGSVYDIGDTGFTTPLNLTLVATNTVTTTLVSDANGMFPDFTLVDRTSVVFKSGASKMVLTTTTPVPGPKGDPSTVPGPPGPPTTDASLLAAGTVADERLPARLQDAALSATYVPKWKANTAYATGEKVLSPGGDVVSAKAAFTSGPSYSAANWDLSPTVTAKVEAPEIVAAVSRPLPPRPAKPQVVFTFDDGWLTDMTVVKPILDTKGIKATFCVVSNYVGSSPTQRLDWTKVRQLQSEGHEIVNHSKTHTNMSAADLAFSKTEIEDSHAVFLANGVRPVGFCWPFQVSSAVARSVARKTYRYALGGAGAVRQPFGTYQITRTSLNGQVTLASLQARVDTAKANNELLIFLTHATDTELDATGLANLNGIIDYVKAQGVEIVTASQAFEAVGNLIDTEDFVIDGAGKLYSSTTTPAWGRVFWGGSSNITAATTPAEFTGGTITYHTISAGSNTDWPATGFGNVITQRLNTSSESYTVQHFITSIGAVYTRRGATTTTWGAWAITGGSHSIVDPASPTYPDAAASTYIRGTTLQRVSSSGSTAPGGGAGMLITNRLQSDYCVQEFHGYAGGNMYRRMTDGAGAWTAWKQVTLT